MILNAEKQRLEEHHTRKANWKKWGPYLSERAWGTVREDYSLDGDAWAYFPHDQARSRTYRWNEDGLGGISDRNQYVCLSLTLWNGNDPILKERIFGLSNTEGNHGEDVKEYYYFIDNTPTHSYMKMLYKYPHEAFPYELLIEENKKRGYDEREYELADTGIFDDNRYFDVFISYAKGGEDDVLMEVQVHNRGEAAHRCLVMPTLWFRNTWSWGYVGGPMNDTPEKPQVWRGSSQGDRVVAELSHPALGHRFLYAEGEPQLLFTENETNQEAVWGTPNKTPYVKDSFHRYLIHGDKDSVHPEEKGTKMGVVYDQEIPGKGSITFRLRLTPSSLKTPFDDFSSLVDQRKKEADIFYNGVQKEGLSTELKEIQRQAFAGMLWSKQLYYYDMERWLTEDHGKMAHVKPRKNRRNIQWEHLVNFDVLSMPDTWEYPWYASWDLAFHCIALVLIDSDFAKRQLTLMTREWYMHPNGQLPAYEWNFSDVNSPVLAWAALRVYKIDAKQKGKADRKFLEGIFHKMLLNFTWWVNRKDAEGNNVFQGGFLGMDNISLFDRSAPLATGERLDQADGTSWMCFFCILMMKIALELAAEDPIYQDDATKFFEHFLRISYAIKDCGKKGYSLWDEEDGFFYDALNIADKEIIPLKVRSLVGLLPLFSVETIEPSLMQKVSVFQRRMDWFISRRPDYKEGMACMYEHGVGRRRLLAILDEKRLRSILRYLLDENEFLSDYGIRSVSKVLEKKPYRLKVNDQEYSIDYEPAESKNKLFGGNSNWRGPIWFPINFLIIESLQKFHHYYGDSFQVEFPTGSGRMLSLQQVAKKLSERLIRIFTEDEQKKRPVYQSCHDMFQNDPLWSSYILFHEYFHGETGQGLGANHQTGWTGLIAKLIQQSG